MSKKILISVVSMVAVLFGLCAVHAADKTEKKKPMEFRNGYADIYSEVTPEDIKKMTEKKNWPVRISFHKDADANIFEVLKKFPHLKMVSFHSVNAMKDFSMLKELKNLEYLYVNRPIFNDKVIFDYSELSHLKNLKKLDFSSVKGKNVEALKNCSSLVEAKFYMSPIDSLEFVSGTPNLEKLDLYGFKHTFPSYAPLANLKKLKWLNVYMNKQATDKNLAVLEGLNTLETFKMANCKQITSLNFLRNCRSLKELSATWAEKLEDISVLGELPELQKVDLWDVPIKNIGVFKGKKKLEELNLKRTRIKDISPLATCPKLEGINLCETEVTDLSPLANCQELGNLDLEGTKVHNLSLLASCAKLKWLNLKGTNVTDLSSLAKCTKLQRLELSESVPGKEIEALKKKLPKCRVEIKKLKQ